MGGNLGASVRGVGLGLMGPQGLLVSFSQSSLEKMSFFEHLLITYWCQPLFQVNEIDPLFLGTDIWEGKQAKLLKAVPTFLTFKDFFFFFFKNS